MADCSSWIILCLSSWTSTSYFSNSTDSSVSSSRFSTEVEEGVERSVKCASDYVQVWRGGWKAPHVCVYMHACMSPSMVCMCIMTHVCAYMHACMGPSIVFMCIITSYMCIHACMYVWVLSWHSCALWPHVSQHVWEDMQGLAFAW